MKIGKGQWLGHAHYRASLSLEILSRIIQPLSVLTYKPETQKQHSCMATGRQGSSRKVQQPGGHASGLVSCLSNRPASNIGA